MQHSGAPELGMRCLRMSPKAIPGLTGLGDFYETVGGTGPDTTAVYEQCDLIEYLVWCRLS